MTQERINEEVKNALHDLVLITVQTIVDHPDDVSVEIVPASYRLLAELHTNPNDVGQVLGRRGHVIASIKSLVTALAGKSKIRMELDYVTDKANFHKKG